MKLLIFLCKVDFEVIKKVVTGPESAQNLLLKIRIKKIIEGETSGVYVSHLIVKHLT